MTKTIPVSDIYNLRLGFIVLGSTQMCSALILVNVLIFALPMSTTQVVISGLTGVSIIFFAAIDAELTWFIQEVILWIIAPVMGMVMAYFAKHLMDKHILNHPECRKRILIMTPYYMTFTFYLMLVVPLTKNFIFETVENESHFYEIAYACILVLFPFFFLILFRYLMLRRARNVESVKLKRQKNKEIREATSQNPKAPIASYL